MRFNNGCTDPQKPLYSGHMNPYSQANAVILSASLLLAGLLLRVRAR